MTAAVERPAHPSWSLLHREHEQHPADAGDRVEWAIEQLIGEYCDTDDERWFRMIEDHRPDFTSAQVFEAVERLCALSGEVFELRTQGRGRTGACVVLEREYAEALAELATPPRPVVDVRPTGGVL